LLFEQESWWRQLQVLPARTHPTMSTSGTGGYLLSGTKVVAPVAAGAAATNGKRQRHS
jgi:tRNA (adenine58-N1)-methyltransferase non-catalytic subunit